MTETVGMVLAGGLGRRMGGNKPKVLYEVEGVPMVVRALDALREGGVPRLVAVLSHRSDEVAAALPEDTEVVVQDRPRGTASAVVDSRHLLSDPETILLISFGDMPWLNPRSVKRMVDAVKDGHDGAVLTFVFDDPPQFGRILRDADGNFVDIRQQKDCDNDQLGIQELDVGMFCFRAGPLLQVLDQLDSDNAQGELYLTDCPGLIAKQGGKVACVQAERLEEALGVNDKRHLQFAESLPQIRSSEEILKLADEVYQSIVTGHGVSAAK